MDETDVIAQTAIILVMVRKNFPKLQMEEKIAHIKKQFWADIRLLKCDRMDVSSTQVRRLLRAKSQAGGQRSPKGAESFWMLQLCHIYRLIIIQVIEYGSKRNKEKAKEEP